MSQIKISTKAVNSRNSKLGKSKEKRPVRNVIKPYRILKQIKSLLKSICSQTQYSSEMEGAYLRCLSDLCSILSNKQITLDTQGVYSIIEPQIQFKGLLQLFCKLTKNKQVVMAILNKFYHFIFWVMIKNIPSVKNQYHTPKNFNEQSKNVLNKQMITSQKSFSKIQSQNYKEYIKASEYLSFLQKGLFQSIEFLLIMEVQIDGFSEKDVETKIQTKNMSLNVNNQHLECKKQEKNFWMLCVKAFKKYLWLQKVLNKFQEQKLKQIQILQTKNTMQSGSAKIYQNVILFQSLLELSETIYKNLNVLLKIQ